MDIDDQVVFLKGNVSDGFCVIGPYPSWDTAFQAHETEEGWFMTLHPPAGTESALEPASRLGS